MGVAQLKMDRISRYPGFCSVICFGSMNPITIRSLGGPGRYTDWCRMDGGSRMMSLETMSYRFPSTKWYALGLRRIIIS